MIKNKINGFATPLIAIGLLLFTALILYCIITFSKPDFEYELVDFFDKFKLFIESILG